MRKELKTVKKMKWVITIILKDEDEDGEPIFWSAFTEDYYADTLEEAEIMKVKFLNGEDEYYGDLIEDCYVSDGPREIELLKLENEE